MRTALGRYSWSARVSAVPGGAATPSPARRVPTPPARRSDKGARRTRPPLTAQVVGPLVQHPLHGARGPSARAAPRPPSVARRPSHRPRPLAARSPGSRGISRRCRAAPSRRPVPARGRPAGLTSSARRRGHCGGLGARGRDPAAAPRPGGQGAGWARGAAGAFPEPQARRGSPAAPPRAESATRRARGPLAHAQCGAHAQVPQIHSRLWRRRRRRGRPSRRGPRGNRVLGGELGSQPPEGRREASETSVDTLRTVNEAVVGSSPTSRCLGVNVAS